MGDLVNDLLDAILRGDLLFRVAAPLSQSSKLQDQGMTQVLISLKADRPADPQYAGRGGEGAGGQLPHGEFSGLLGIFQDKGGSLLFGAAERCVDFTQAQENVLHGGLLVDINS